jgi:hypothetical protein
MKSFDQKDIWDMWLSSSVNVSLAIALGEIELQLDPSPFGSFRLLLALLLLGGPFNGVLLARHFLVPFDLPERASPGVILPAVSQMIADLECFA